MSQARPVAQEGALHKQNGRPFTKRTLWQRETALEMMDNERYLANQTSHKQCFIISFEPMNIKGFDVETTQLTLYLARLNMLLHLFEEVSMSRTLR